MSDPVRRAALSLLCEVESGHALEPLLEAATQERGTDARDMRFLRQLCSGVLKWSRRLDWVVDGYASRPVESLSPAVRQILRLATYQILHLDRVPARAAVHSAVELTKMHERGATGFVNAVLRRIAHSDGDADTLPDPQSDRVRYLGVLHSHPDWLVRRWRLRWGECAAIRLLEANNETPSLFVRENILQGMTAGDLGVEAPPMADHAGVHRVNSPEGFFATQAFVEGRCYVQDVNAGIAAQLLEPQPGENILDLCAAPGGKSANLAAMTRDTASIVACDWSPTRLRRMKDNLRRLGIRRVHLVVEDGVSPACREALFDRALVDVPCSGTGVLGRRPDARWRKAETDLPAHAHRQLQLLECAYVRVRPGGIIVYSTCSLEEEENDAVVDRFLARHSKARLEPASRWFPGRALAGRSVQTLPGREVGDGSFAARLRKE